MRDFDWEKFKRGNIAVYCQSREVAINFIKECSENNIIHITGDKVSGKLSFWGINKNYTCYSMVNRDGSSGKGLKVYHVKDKKDGIELIEWEIDTMK